MKFYLYISLIIIFCSCGNNSVNTNENSILGSWILEFEKEIFLVNNVVLEGDSITYLSGEEIFLINVQENEVQNYYKSIYDTTYTVSHTYTTKNNNISSPFLEIDLKYCFEDNKLIISWELIIEDSTETGIFHYRKYNGTIPPDDWPVLRYCKQSELDPFLPYLSLDNDTTGRWHK